MWALICYILGWICNKQGCLLGVDRFSYCALEKQVRCNGFLQCALLASSQDRTFDDTSTYYKIFKFKSQGAFWLCLHLNPVNVRCIFLNVRRYFCSKITSLLIYLPCLWTTSSSLTEPSITCIDDLLRALIVTPSVFHIFKVIQCSLVWTHHALMPFFHDQ